MSRSAFRPAICRPSSNSGRSPTPIPQATRPGASWPSDRKAFAVIADRVGGNGLYSSNAQLKVYKLIGDFNPDEAISHGFIDSQMLPAWRSTDASLAP